MCKLFHPRPACKRVIVFDKFRSHTGFVQARGRARDMNGSSFILMVEKGNQSILKHFVQAKCSEVLTRQAVETLDNIQVGCDDEAIGDMILGNLNEPLVTSLGATLHESCSIGIMNWIACLYRSEPIIEVSDSSSFDWFYLCQEYKKQTEYFEAGKKSEFDFLSSLDEPPFGYIAKVTFNSVTIYSAVRINKKMAKQSAAFVLCRQLYKAGELDEHLFPKIARKKDKFLNITPPKKQRVVHQIEWKIPRILQENGKHLTVIYNKHYTECFGILTSSPLPLSSVQLYLHQGPTDFQTKSLGQVNEQDYEKIQQHQNLLWEAFYKRPFKKRGMLFGSIDQRCYSIVPMMQQEEDWVIHWDVFDALQQQPMTLYDYMYKQKSSSTNFSKGYCERLSYPLSDKMMADQQDLKHNLIVFAPHNNIKYLILDLEPHLNALTTFFKEEEITHKKYFEDMGYSIPHQEACLARAKIWGTPKNYLVPPEEPSKGSVYIVPDVFQVIPISKQLFDISRMFPSTLYMIQLHCLVDEFIKAVKIPIPSSLILPAFIAPASKLYPHYERLETLGDAFLKFGVSWYLYMTRPKMSEGYLSAERNSLISNANLESVAFKMNFQGLLMTHPFFGKFWAPPGCQPWQLEKGEAIEPVRLVSSKMVADFVESTIGAYCCLGQSQGLKYLEYLGLIQSFDTKLPPKDVNLGPYHQVIPLVESRLNYTFNRKELIVSAVSFQTFSLQVENYQRLEFLGDAILDALVVKYLYQTHPDYEPCFLSEFKTALVNNQTLATIAIHMNLLPLIQNIPTADEEQGKMFQSLLGDKETDPNLFEFEAPKYLGDVVEALIGAVFLDCQDLKMTWQLFSPYFERVLQWISSGKSPVRELYEFLRRELIDLDLLVFHQTEQECTVYLDGVCLCSAKANTKTLSKRLACVRALETLRNANLSAFK